jgi:ACR3 family arsenite efflux pump ArsB
VTRLTLERYQVWIYVTALAIGANLGLSAPGLSPGLEALIWPALAILLYAAFSQVPLVHLTQALRHGRFLSAMLTANFIFVPALVWLLTRFLPPDPAILLGAFMVLLVPCTDWFIAFTHLGHGETRLALAATPVMLLAQIVLLPLYLGLFMGAQFMDLVSTGPFLQAFFGLIVLPLGLALATEQWAKRHAPGVRWLALLGWLPVPFLALVLLLIAASQVSALGEWLQRPGRVVSVVGVLWPISSPPPIWAATAPGCLV